MTRRNADLKVIVALAVTAGLAFAIPGVPWPLEWALGSLVLLVLPGYAAIAALFPTRPSGEWTGSPGWPARLGLSVLVSALLVAVVGYLLLVQSVVGFSASSVVLLLAGVTLLGVGIAADRRTGLPDDRLADPLYGASIRSVSRAFGTTGVQSVAVVLSVVVLASALAFAGTTPPTQPHSEVYLTGGDDVAVGPTNGTSTLTAGAPNAVALAIANHEGEPTDYRVVVELQRLGTNGTVVERERLDTVRVGLGPGETRTLERDLRPSLTGEDLRLQFRVQKVGHDGESADLTLRSWVTVVDRGST